MGGGGDGGEGVLFYLFSFLGGGAIGGGLLHLSICCLSAFIELQVLLLENIGTSLKVGPDQLPSLHHLLTEAAAILQMEVPDLYVRQVRVVDCSQWLPGLLTVPL